LLINLHVNINYCSYSLHQAIQRSEMEVKDSSLQEFRDKYVKRHCFCLSKYLYDSFDLEIPEIIIQIIRESCLGFVEDHENKSSSTKSLSDGIKKVICPTQMTLGEIRGTTKTFKKGINDPGIMNVGFRSGWLIDGMYINDKLCGNKGGGPVKARNEKSKRVIEFAAEYCQGQGYQNYISPASVKFAETQEVLSVGTPQRYSEYKFHEKAICRGVLPLQEITISYDYCICFIQVQFGDIS